MKALKAQAKAEELHLVEVEGAKHTKVSIAERQSTVPRHEEIHETTAAAIPKPMGVEG